MMENAQDQKKKKRRGDGGALLSDDALIDIMSSMKIGRRQ